MKKVVKVLLLDDRERRALLVAVRRHLDRIPGPLTTINAQELHDLYQDLKERLS